MGKVLVLDGMWNKSLAAVRSFGRKGLDVTTGEKTLLATAMFSRYCNKRFVYPSPVLSPAGFLKDLEEELKRNSYDVVFPMEFSTQVLLTDPVNRQKLEQYTRIPFASADLAKKCNDKAFIMRHAMERGIDIPATYFVNDTNSIAGIAQKLEYPALIKPRVSSGSRGIVYVKNKDELTSLYGQVHKQYPFPIIQEYIPGDEVYGVGLLLNFESEVRASFVYKRLRSYPVKGGPSTLRESVQRDDIREIAISLMKSLEWTGIAHAEFKIDPRDGKPKLLEVNPRFWGSLQLAIESGVDFPLLLFKMAMDGDIESVVNYAVGVKCRWLIPGDVLHFIKNPERLRLKPNFFDFKIKDDIISLKDPLPILGRISSVLTFFYDKEMKDLLNR
ncbi:MAG: ATP-grasp domain-containing protein [Candidatus Jettenia caeni]|nr:MAG: ATP-grasp domain-containing protein [Candidatus Jettenia caeni]